MHSLTHTPTLPHTHTRTHTVAFGAAANVDFPGVKWFCYVAAIVIFCLFILTCTLFAAMLVLWSTPRMRAHRQIHT